MNEEGRRSVRPGRLYIYFEVLQSGARLGQDGGLCAVTIGRANRRAGIDARANRSALEEVVGQSYGDSFGLVGCT
jgi:hypothetical protein